MARLVVDMEIPRPSRPSARWLISAINPDAAKAMST